MAGVTIRIEGSAALLRQIENLSEAVKAKMIERALVSGALVIQNSAKQRAPYLTGNLRRSIHIGGHEDLNPDGGDIVDRSQRRVPRPELGANKVAVYVGTDVNYAAPVEYGTVRRRPKPYLRPAADENKSAVRREVAEALGDLIRAAVR